MKIVVVDLDETLGYFTEYGIFWDCLTQYFKNKNKSKLTQQYFNDTLDLYPEFLRPNIIKILHYLKTKKESKCCHKMMIYTNNTGPKEWAHNIIGYFEQKINYRLIDQIILAFKINGKSVEICRTTHDKTHKDLIKCTKMPANSEICFLDDTFYPEMATDNIYYINVKPYYHDLPFEYMLQKFEESEVGKKIINNDDNFNEQMLELIKPYMYYCVDKQSAEYDIDKIIGKHIITHLQDFFNKSKKNKTIRHDTRKNNKRNKTRKCNLSMTEN